MTDGEVAQRPLEVELEVPHERRRRPATGCWPPTSSPGCGRSGRRRDGRPRGPLRRHARRRARRRRVRGPAPEHRRRHGHHAQGPRATGRRRRRRIAARSSRGRPIRRPRRLAWPESAARDVVVAIAGDQRARGARPCSARLRRKRLYGKDGTVVELSRRRRRGALGRPRRWSGSRSSRLEVREGDEAVLEPLAELLGEIEELVPAGTSKLERALEAVRRERAAEADGSATTTRPPRRRSSWMRPRASRRRCGRRGAAEPSIEEELAVGPRHRTRSPSRTRITPRTTRWIRSTRAPRTTSRSRRRSRARPRQRPRRPPPSRPQPLHPPLWHPPLWHRAAVAPPEPSPSQQRNRRRRRPRSPSRA